MVEVHRPEIVGKFLHSAKLLKLGCIICTLFFLLPHSVFPQTDRAPRIIYAFYSEIKIPPKTLKEIRQPPALDADIEGNLYIADRTANRIIKLDNKLNILSVTAGWGSSGDRFDTPVDVSADNSLNVLVADYVNGRIVRLDKDLNYLYDITLSKLNRQYEFPLSVAVSSWGDIYILEELAGSILMMQSSMSGVIEFGGFKPGKSSSAGAVRISTDDQGILYAAVPDENLIVAYDQYGNFIGQIKTDFPPLAMDSYKGILFCAGKGRLVSYSENKKIEVSLMNKEQFDPDMQDIVVVENRLYYLIGSPPYLQLFHLSSSPARIEW